MDVRDEDMPVDSHSNKDSVAQWTLMGLELNNGHMMELTSGTPCGNVKADHVKKHESNFNPSDNTNEKDDFSVGLPQSVNFLDPKNANFFPSSVMFPQTKLTSVANPPENSGLPNVEIRDNIYSLQFSPPTQGNHIYMSTPQNMAQHDQLMMQQVEQLQRLVKEQQKLITLFNPGLVLPPGLPSSVFAIMPPAQPQVPNNEEKNENSSQQLSRQQNNQDASVSVLPLTIPSNETPKKCPEKSCSSSQETLKNSTQQEPSPKALSPVREEKDEDVHDAPISPFGVRTKIKNREERPIRPAVVERQKTFEEFVEEQLKLDSGILEKERLQTNMNPARKSFLKRREGINRFEKKSDTSYKEQRRHSVTTLSRKPSFDGQHRNSLPTIPDIGKIQLKNRLVFVKPEIKADKITNNAISSTIPDEFGKPFSQETSDNQVQQSVKEYCNLNTQDITTTDLKVASLAVQQANYPMANTLSDEPITKDIEGNCQKSAGPEVQNEDLAVVKLSRASDDRIDPANKTGFKKVNDKIVKVNSEILIQNKIRNCKSVTESRKKTHNFDGGVHYRKDVGSLSETDSSSSCSVDDPKSHCYKLPSHDASQMIRQADKHLDLSDPDYATDEPSGEEEIKNPKSAARSIHRDHSFSTSGSEHSTEDFRKRGGKAFSSFRSTTSRYLRTPRMDKDHNKNIDAKDSTEKVEQHPPSTSDIVTSLFPVFKTKSDISQNMESSKNSSDLFTRKIEETCQVIYDNPVIAKMKEEQEKAMAFLRQQLDQFEKLKADEMNRLEELKRNELRTIQREKEELEKQAAAAKAIKSKEQSEEIQMLKQQISELQGKFRRNEFAWSSTHEQLKRQVEALTRENQELRSELRVSEINNNDVTNSRSESLVSQAILRGTSFTKSDVRLEPTVHKSRSRTPVGRKTPVSSENSAKITSLMERTESIKALQRNGDKPLSGSVANRSTTPTGRKTPLQGRITPFEPEKQASQAVPAAHRKSPITLSNLSVFKDSNTPHTKGRPSSYSGSSDDMPTVSLKNEGSNLSNQDTELPSVRRFQDQSIPWEEPGTSLNRTRSHSVHSGRKTPGEPSRGSDVMSTAPKSILSRKALERARNKSNDEDGIQEEIQFPDGKIEQLYSDGRKIVVFTNGTKKETSADGMSTIVTFFNGDVKKTMPDQSIVYYYSDAQTTHTTYPNGLEVLEFPNKQIEKHHPDGTKEIVFPDRTVKLMFKDGREETNFPDGTIVKLEKNGHKTVIFHNGQKEIHTAQFRRREYPDGTIKTIYSNGRQETKYSSGRVRIKDQQGNIILDKK
ncbi:centromere protein J-like [Spea bombifrons]|uniref:centromere protein J-like n=1 Tax=Spea bombifrons TaxID=233779 RepID=UPI00234943F1|nr:centromere protein J-like [Spea bombifrons]